jgi:hypothetical protein
VFVAEAEIGRMVACPKCQTTFAALSRIPQSDSPPASSAAFSGTNKGAGSKGFSDLSHGFDIFGKGERKHSGLGMASFIIALLVGGLDVILALIIAVGIARSAHHPAGREDFSTYRPHSNRGDLMDKVLAGGMAMVCLNCMSIPLCLVGVGLALVGLIAHRDCNHLSSWIGLMGNMVVIVGVVGLYILGALQGV